MNKYISAAEERGNIKDVNYLMSLQESVKNGERRAPRSYARKYGLSTRKINDDLDYLEGFLFRPEYNLLDAIRLYTASFLYQEALLKESSQSPVTDIVTEMDIPVYFVMGKYDGMTSPEAAEAYLDELVCHQNKEFVLFENSAHFPQFEESQKFFQWIKDTFGE